jgi:hypothetical protein
MEARGFRSASHPILAQLVPIRRSRGNLGEARRLRASTRLQHVLTVAYLEGNLTLGRQACAECRVWTADGLSLLCWTKARKSARFRADLGPATLRLHADREPRGEQAVRNCQIRRFGSSGWIRRRSRERHASAETRGDRPWSPFSAEREMAPRAGFEPATLRLTAGTNGVSRALPEVAALCWIERRVHRNGATSDLRPVPALAGLCRRVLHRKGKERATSKLTERAQG